MGCSGLNAKDFEDNDEKNLLIKIYKGELTKNAMGTDNELEDKLRSFIALKVKKKIPKN